jgi:hypothetical protein
MHFWPVTSKATVKNNPPIIRQLLCSGSDPSGRTVTLVVGLEDGGGTEIHLQSSVIDAVVAALAAESNKLKWQILQAQD